MSLAVVVGLAVASACNSKNNPNNPDSGVHFGDDASFESGVEDTGTPREASAVDSGTIVDAPADVTTYPPSAGSSGAFGVVTVNGKQKLYMPSNVSSAAGNATVAAVDVGVVGNGVSGAPALVHSIDLGTTNAATCTGGDSSMIVAASTASNDIWFIDPSTDLVVKHINLDSTYGQSSFSSGGGYVTGIATDPSTHTAILSVWNGYALVDLTTQTITANIQAPPAENFGYDSVHRRIFAPFYNCSASVANGMPPSSCNTPMAPEGGVMGAGLSVIDLNDNNTVYTYEDPAAMDPTNPLGGEPDSAGVDPTTQIVIVPSENEGYENFLDFSHATFDKTTLTVTAPHVIFSGTEDEGVAIEPNSHLAFWEGEGSQDVVTANSVQAMAGNAAFVDGTMPDDPGGGFSTLSDPHGVAVSASIINNKPVGFLVDSGLQWVARIDLTGFAAMQQNDAGVTLTMAQMAGFVTYLDSTTSESGGE